MPKLERSDLWSLEEYAEKRADFRSEVMQHKRHRNLNLGEHMRLYFEDAKTIRYQVQEMLRIEKVFEAAGIQEELDAYNPLIPDGMNWKATFMIEYPEIEERKQMLGKLIGVEDRVWMQVEGFDRVWPIADEDLERSTEEKTSSVHFMRWELEPSMIVALKKGRSLFAGVEHENCHIDAIECSDPLRISLTKDLKNIEIN
jgi:hypothetical protein